MRTNRTKAKLQQGKMVFGAAVGFDSPHTVELPDALGFGYVTLDLDTRCSMSAPFSTLRRQPRLPSSLNAYQGVTGSFDYSRNGLNKRTTVPSPSMGEGWSLPRT